MKNWLRQHGFAISATFRQLGKAPLSFLFNVLVLAVTLALPFAGLTVLENVRPLSEQLVVEPEISLFLVLELPRDKALGLGATIKKLLQDSAKSARVTFIPREKALDMMKGKTGLSDLLTSLGGNPLPDAYVLKLEGFNNATDAARIDVLADQLRALPGVEAMQVDSAWIKRLAALLGVLRLALLFLALALGLVVIAVVFNTIRLQVLTQLEEIEVSKLIGATDAFIHRPFYYAGALLGGCSGGVALGVVALALRPLNAAIAQFAQLYASEFQLVPLGWPAMALLIGGSAGLGLVGALLSVKRHLARVG